MYSIISDILSEIFDDKVNPADVKVYVNKKPVTKSNRSVKIDHENEILENIDRILFRDPVIVVFWSDRTKTVVRCSEQETFDPEKGLAMAIIKKIFGNKYYMDLKEVIDIFNVPEVKTDKKSDNKTSESKKTDTKKSSSKSKTTKKTTTKKSETVDTNTTDKTDK